jgi:SNF2 family DNA or RNA helicase
MMLQSPLGACILADGTGLGKTVSTYCTLVQLSIDIDKKQKDFDGTFPPLQRVAATNMS